MISDREQNAMKRYSLARKAVEQGIVMCGQHQLAEIMSNPVLAANSKTQAADHAALVDVLIEAGIVKREDYFEALARHMVKEKHALQDKLSERLGVDVKLG